MNDPMAAFGIFSIRRDTAGLIKNEPFLFSRSYQTDFIRGPYYIKVIHPNTDEAKNLAGKFIEKIRAELPDYSGNYGLDKIITNPDDPEKIKKLKYINGKLADRKSVV